MLKTLLGLNDDQTIAGFDFNFTGGWITALLLFAAALALVVYLYRSESRLTQGRRIFMGVCKGLALLVLILIILSPVAGIQMIQPTRRTVLVLVDSSRSMAIDDQRMSAKDVGEAASVLGKLPPGQQLQESAVASMRKQLGTVSRFDLAKAALTNKEIDFVGKLKDKYNVRFLSFDKQLKSEGDVDDPTGWLKDRTPKGEASQVGTAIEEAVSRHAGQPIASVVVLSDFAWADGRDPVQVARDLKKQGVRVFPVPIGLPKPPDVHVRRVIGPEVVFKGDRVPLRIQLESHGFAGKIVELELAVDGQRSSSQQIELKDGLQFAEVMFIPQKDSGSIKLDVNVPALAGETTKENNTASHKVQIIDQKIKVLYIEGMPRWEYRYLRWVLLRDTRLDVKFLMTQGDPELATTSPRHLGRFPQVAKDAFQFDLVILGDVPASYFTGAQMDLIDDLVKKGGGSLLMIAGPVGAPGTYGDSPIAKMLPVKIGSGQWEATNATPVVTPAGQESAITTLSPSPQTNARIWANVRPMYLPPLDGAKPGATVLLTKSREAEQLQDYPLVAWQRYGTGKSMFVATEDLWRMRLEVGDRYHSQFWGQSIQFLALSRLLGKNKQITLETDRRTYGAGEQVQVYANVLTQSFDPVVQPSYTVVLNREGADGSATELELKPAPDSPGLYIGVHMAGAEGSYKLKTQPQDAEVSNQVGFEIANIQMEDRETAAQTDVARQIAEQSGGKSLGLLDLGGLSAELGKETPLFKRSRLEMDLWDTPLLFILLGLFASIEWFMRRRNNLV